MAKFHSRAFRTFIITFACLALLASASYVLGWSHLFVVKSVRVIGAPTEFDKETIAKEVSLGERLARLDKHRISQNLQKLAWLNSSNVQTDWFKGKVTMRVTVRKPVARIDGEFVDSAGFLFQLHNVEAARLPLVIADTHEKQLVAVTLIALLPNSFKKMLQVVSVPGIHSVTIYLQSSIKNSVRPITVFWGDASNTSLKVRVYQSLLALPENSNITEIDLSAPHAPIVK